MRLSFALLLACAMTVPLSGSGGTPADVATRARAARKVVVAKIVGVQSRFDVNRWGDRLIVSDALVFVEETLKGAHTPSLVFTVEGGTVGDLTLEVSDMPAVKDGEQVVLFLGEEQSGRHLPYGRGQGVLKLEPDGRVRGSNLTINDVRRTVRAAQ